LKDVRVVVFERLGEGGDGSEGERILCCRNKIIDIYFVLKEAEFWVERWSLS
jgi:hypothetical protein